jgi:hypothetical protein
VLDRLLGVAARQRPIGLDVGSGRKKSAPFSASACSTFWSKAMTEIRCPWVARVLLASFLSKGLSLEIVEQPATDTAAVIIAVRSR